jgi:precorrin-2 dehydrogenase/sirohydrochlorin ferrochelatase
MRAEAIGLPITLDLDGQTALLVGDDEEAARKRELLEEAGAQVRVAMPGDFEETLLDGARLVMVTVRDEALAVRVHAAARTRGILCWCSDRPDDSDFAMPAVARLGAARFAIATGGASPTLAGRLRAALVEQLGSEFARFVSALAALREQTQRSERDPARRREQLAKALDGFVLEVRARYPTWFR